VNLLKVLLAPHFDRAVFTDRHKHASELIVANVNNLVLVGSHHYREGARVQLQDTQRAIIRKHTDLSLVNVDIHTADGLVDLDFRDKFAKVKTPQFDGAASARSKCELFGHEYSGDAAIVQLQNLVDFPSHVVDDVK
jgi:hypothetical protein